MDATVVKQLRRLRTLGRGASGAVVWLASDDASGELLAVKSAGADAAEQLRREERLMSGLCSPHIVPCLGSRAAAAGGYQLFLEFAPGGSLADEAARSGGRLPERAIRAYTADVARGLAYLHGNWVVHGDVKARNIMVCADGRAKLADFGCARTADSDAPIGGTPAFMAPEVARGEEQARPADVWALGCTVIEMATGRVPMTDIDDIIAAVHRIGYTDAVPELPGWLSPEAKDFLGKCFTRNPRHRSTAAQLLEHPFLASTFCDADADAEPAKHNDWMSPKSTLNAGFWESDDEDETEETFESATERIGSLAIPCSALPDWDSDDGWIDVHTEQTQVSGTPAATVMAGGADFGPSSEALGAEVDLRSIDVDRGSYLMRDVGGARGFVEYDRYFGVDMGSDKPLCPISCHESETVELGYHCNGEIAIKFYFAQIVSCDDLPYLHAVTTIDPSIHSQFF